MDWITGELNTQNETHTDSLLSREWKEGRKEGKREGGREGRKEGGKERRKERGRERWRDFSFSQTWTRVSIIKCC